MRDEDVEKKAEKEEWQRTMKALADRLRNDCGKTLDVVSAYVKDNGPEIGIPIAEVEDFMALMESEDAELVWICEIEEMIMEVHE